MKTHTQAIQIERPIGVNEGRALRNIVHPARTVIDTFLFPQPGGIIECGMCSATGVAREDEEPSITWIRHTGWCDVGRVARALVKLARACARDAMTTRPAGLGERCEECHRSFFASELVIETPVGLLCHTRPHQAPRVEVTR